MQKDNKVEVVEETQVNSEEETSTDSNIEVKPMSEETIKTVDNFMRLFESGELSQQLEQVIFSKIYSRIAKQVGIKSIRDMTEALISLMSFRLSDELTTKYKELLDLDIDIDAVNNILVMVNDTEEYAFVMSTGVVYNIADEGWTHCEEMTKTINSTDIIPDITIELNTLVKRLEEEKKTKSNIQDEHEDTEEHN